MKNFFKQKDKKVHEQEKLALSLELAEIREVSDIIFKKIDRKLRQLESVEAAADKKIAELERLIERTGSVRYPEGMSQRRHEILNLSTRGLPSREIADILNIPAGEVDLILELNGQPTG